MKLKRIIIELIEVLLILLFMYAAVSKLLDYQHFHIQLSKSPLITPYASFAAIAIPLVEIITSILLAQSRTVKIGLYASLFLLTLFTTYLIAMLNFSSYIPCSCGGILQGLSWETHIVFNLTFIVLNLLVLILGNSGKHTEYMISEFNQQV